MTLRVWAYGAAVSVLTSTLTLGCSNSESSGHGSGGGGGAGGSAGGSGGDMAGSGVTGGAGALGGTSGMGGASAMGGGSGKGGSGGSGGSSAAAGATGGAGAPSNPLCPASGPIVEGSMPLPDGVEIASMKTDAKLMAVSDDYVYWANDTTIRRISVADNTEEVVLDRSDTDFTIEGLAIDADNLYFSESGVSAGPPGPLGVAKAPLDGKGDPVSLANEGPDVYASSMAGITVADGYVYYLNLRTQEISRVSVDGGDSTLMVRTANPSTMVVAGGYLWFQHPITNASDNVNLIRVPVDAMAPPADTPPDAVNVPPGTQAVAPVFNYRPTAVAADSKSVYYDDANKVTRIPIAGGTPEVLAQAADHAGFVNPDTTYVAFIAPTKSGIFWDVEQSPACGSLMKTAVDGSSTMPLLSTVAAPWLLGANAKYLYFSAAGQILRVPL